PAHRFCGGCGAALQAAGDEDSTPSEAPLAALQAAQRLLDAGNAHDAIRAIEAACAVQPQWPASRILLGIAYLRAGRVLDAQDALDAAERLAPHTFACEVAFAEYHARLGFFDRAVERLDRALDLPAPDARARDAAVEMHRYCVQHARKMFYRRTPL